MWRHCNEEIKDTVNVMHDFVHVVPIVYQTEEHKNEHVIVGWYLTVEIGLLHVQQNYP